MRKLALIILLLFMGLAFAEPANFSQYANDTVSRLQQEGNAFVTATQAGAGTAYRIPTVFEAFSPGYCGNSSSAGSLFGGGSSAVFDFATPMLLIIIIIATVIIIIYMVAQVLQSPGLTAVARDEGVQLMFTVIRVVFVAVIFIAINTWFVIRSSGVNDPDSIYKIQNPFDPAGGLPMIDAAMGFSRSVIVEMITTFSNLVLYNTVIHTIYTSTMWFGVTWRVQYSFNLGPVLKPLVDIVGMALQFLSLGISEWMLHLITLCLIKKWAWTLFIPMSILLRSIPQTRGAGEALFAISFALMVVYPFMFITTYETHKLLKNNIIDDTGAVSSFIQKSGILAVAGSVLVLMFLMAGVFFPFFIGMAMNLAFELIRNAVYYSVILSLLLPFLNIFITLTAAREVAKFFDVDVSFMSFIKII